MTITIDQAKNDMSRAQAALSRLNTLLVMMKVTSEYIGGHKDQAGMIEWIDVTDMLIDLMEDISFPIEKIDQFLNSLSYASKGGAVCQQ